MEHRLKYVKHVQYSKYVHPLHRSTPPPFLFEPPPFLMTNMSKYAKQNAEYEPPQIAIENMKKYTKLRKYVISTRALSPDLSLEILLFCNIKNM